jgi:hypothetical protein
MKTEDMQVALARWNKLADQWGEIERRIRERRHSLPTLRAYCRAANALHCERSDTLYFIATTWPGEPDPEADVVLPRCALSAAKWIKHVNRRLDRGVTVKQPATFNTFSDFHIAPDDVAAESRRRWPIGEDDEAA